MKKKVMRLSRLLVSLLLCMVMIIPAGTAMKAQAATDETSGSLGGNVTWNLDVATGKLTIRGNGSIPDYRQGYSPFNEDSRIKSIVIEEGIESIGQYAFSKCLELSKVSISSTVSYIGLYAFWDDAKLTDVSLPKNVNLATGAFYQTGLKSITLSEGMKSTGELAFSKCSFLTEVKLNPDLKKISLGAFEYSTALKSITIPDGVTTIDNVAFRGCTSLTSAIIPATVSTIGNGAFDDCSSKFTIVSEKGTVAETYALENGFAFAEIGSYQPPRDDDKPTTYSWNASTSTLIISGKGEMSNANWIMDSETWNAKNVIIESGITTIVGNAFNSKYKQLSNVKIPNTVTKIGDSAFLGCESLTEITLPNSINSIGTHAFQDSGLKHVEIPDGVTKISQFAFGVCKNLEKVTIPDSVLMIDVAAFGDTMREDDPHVLKTVIVHGEPKTAADFEVQAANEPFFKATFINEPHDSTKPYCKDYVLPDSSPFSDNFVPEMIEEPIVYANSTEDPSSLNCKFYHQNGKSYWYEGGVRQGTYDDPKGVVGDGTVRGREVCDMETAAWYWCDSVLDGAKAINKEVWMPYIYQDEKSWSDAEIKQNAAASIDEHADMSAQLERDIKAHTGKWVRYNANGKMFKGWYKVTSSEAQYYPDQVGNIYYYDPKTGLMAKGDLTIDGVSYHFDETTGVLQK